jgi:hypothetical protein
MTRIAFIADLQRAAVSLEDLKKEMIAKAGPKATKQ